MTTDKPKTIGEALRVKNRFNVEAADTLLDRIEDAIETTLREALRSRGMGVYQRSGHTILHGTGLGTEVLEALEMVELEEFLTDYDQDGDI